MTLLSATVSVAHIVHAGKAQVSFTSTTDPDDEHSEPRHCYYMRRDLWDEFGQPQMVTLTVKPGDLLNDDVL